MTLNTNDNAREAFLARLGDERLYKNALKAYNVRFFPEKKQGTIEMRPEALQGARGLEGWEKVMPADVLEFARAMIRRSTLGVVGVANTIESVRAHVACLIIEADPHFPFNNGSKKQKAEDVIAQTSSLKSASARHEAISSEKNGFLRNGVEIKDGHFIINFNLLNIENLNSLGISGLVDKVRIPLSMLATLDGFDIQDEANLIAWLGSFLKTPRITKEFMTCLAGPMSACGVKIGATIYTIEPNFNLERFKHIAISNAIEGADEITLSDLARLHGHELKTEEDVKNWLDTVFNESRRKKTASLATTHPKSKLQSKSEEGEEDVVLGKMHDILKAFERRKISPARELAIATAIFEGAPASDFANELCEGYQSRVLNLILRKASRYHHYDYDHIFELLGTTNEILLQRLPTIKITTLASGQAAMQRYVDACVMGTITDSHKSELISGVPITRNWSKLLMSHYPLIQEAVDQAEAKGSAYGTVRIPQLNDDPREIRFTVSFMRKFITQQISLGPSGPKRFGEMTENGECPEYIASGKIDVRNIETTLDAFHDIKATLTAKLNKLITAHSQNSKTETIIRFHIDRLFGFTKTPWISLCEILSVTESRISQLRSQLAPTATRILQNFTWEEIQVLRDNIKDLDPEDFTHLDKPPSGHHELQL